MLNINCELIDYDINNIEDKFTIESKKLLPKNNYIGFSSFGEGNESDIFIAEIGKNTRIKLTDDPALDGFPSWEKTGFVPDYSLLTISE